MGGFTGLEKQVWARESQHILFISELIFIIDFLLPNQVIYFF